MGKHAVVRAASGILLWVAMLLLTGCSLLEGSNVKLRDLEFVVLSPERIPKELKTVLEDKMKAPFQITYTDTKNLYICVGYGEQKTGGYSIAVDKLYLTETEIVVDTSLLGPREEQAQQGNAPSYPYLVIRTELLEKPVNFQ